MSAGALTKVIGGGNPVLRDLAMQALARIPDDAALESIVALMSMRTGRHDARWRRLSDWPDRRDGIPSLLPLLADEKQAVRRAAAASLGQLGWRPDDTTDPVSAASYAVAMGNWNRIESYGADAIKPILSFLIDNAWEQRTAAHGGAGQDRRARGRAADRGPGEHGPRRAAFGGLCAGQDRRHACGPAANRPDDGSDRRGARHGRPQPRATGRRGRHRGAGRTPDRRGCCAWPGRRRAGQAGCRGHAGPAKRSQSEDAGVRAIVADALGDTASLEAAYALIGRLSDDAEPVRQASVRGLVHLDEVAIEPLYEQIDSEDTLVRVSVAAIFGQIGRPECIPALYTLVRAEDRARARGRRLRRWKRSGSAAPPRPSPWAMSRPCT